MAEINVVWQDRKRTLFGLPWSFTKYSLTEEKLLVETGFLNKKEEEIRLYRIMDVTLKRSFGERIFGLVPFIVALPIVQRLNLIF